ncbi:MAG: alpha-mannosidase, partial [Planctomycetota bacterium]
MLPRSPHLQFVPPRVEKARGRLEAMIWRVDDTPLPVAQSKSSREETFVGDAAGLAFLPVEQTPHVWGQRFDQCWWKVQIPGAESEASPARARYLCWRDQGEATAYFEGQAVAGIDPGHTMLALPEALWSAAGELLIESICCRTGIWVPGAGQGISDAGSVFEGAFLATRDDDAWAAYFDVEVLLDLAVALHRKDHPLDGDWPSAFGYRPPLEHASPVCRRIIDGLDRAVDALDHDGPAALREVTQKLLADLPADATAMDATLTGHAHIDLVWLWPERTGEFKAVHSLANVLDV